MTTTVKKHRSRTIVLNRKKFKMQTPEQLQYLRDIGSPELADRIQEQQDNVRKLAKKMSKARSRQKMARLHGKRPSTPRKPRVLTPAQRQAQAVSQQKRQARLKANGLVTNTGLPLQSREGSIYIAECQGMYKIGFSKDMYDRRMKLQVNNPFLVSIVYTSANIQGVNFVERALHEKYKAKLVRGEWFSLNATNVKHIKTAVNKIQQADHTITL
jgi:hypothetical protein